MIDRAIDQIDVFTARWRMPLTVVSVAWFGLSCAAYAGFVRVPSITLFSGMTSVAAAGMWNAIWWGYFYPRAVRRRETRDREGRANG